MAQTKKPIKVIQIKEDTSDRKDAPLPYSMQEKDTANKGNVIDFRKYGKPNPFYDFEKKWHFILEPILKKQWVTIIDFKTVGKKCKDKYPYPSDIYADVCIAKTLEGDTIRLISICNEKIVPKKSK